MTTKPSRGNDADVDQDVEARDRRRAEAEENGTTYEETPRHDADADGGSLSASGKTDSGSDDDANDDPTTTRNEEDVPCAERRSSDSDGSRRSASCERTVRTNDDRPIVDEATSRDSVGRTGSVDEKRGNGVGKRRVGDKEREALLAEYSTTDDDHDKTLDHAAALAAEAESDEFVPPDGGWGWVVCLASFWTNGTLFGILNVFGIFYVEFLDEFKDQGEEIFFKLSWIGALEVATTFFMSLFSSILVDLFGIRLISGLGALIITSGMLISSFVHSIELLYLTYGILIGLGSSLVYTPSMTILGHYFRRRLGLVNGFVAFGSAAFTFALSTGLPPLLRAIGLRNTMRVLCLMTGLLGFCPIVWKPLIPRGAGAAAGAGAGGGGFVRRLRGSVNVDMFRNRGYRIWIVGVPISFMGYFIPFVHIVEHTKQMFPGRNAEILVMCIGGISGVSRLISGRLADLPSINRVWIMQFSFVLLGLATALVPYAGRYGLLVSLACVMGLADGCFVCMIGPIAYDLLGPQGMGQGIGVLLGLMSVPMTVGPPLAGFLRGLLGTYKIAFLIAGLPPIIGSCILFLMPKSTPRQLPQLTVTDTIIAMSKEHLDQEDEESAAVLKLGNSATELSECWPQKGSDVTES